MCSKIAELNTNHSKKFYNDNNDIYAKNDTWEPN